MESSSAATAYRGRIAPSPTGLLHLGHARTFWIAHSRAREAGGVLVFRNDDIDSSRVRQEFVAAQMRDLQWFGMEWQEGPDVGGPHAPYSQSSRLQLYRESFDRLRGRGWVFPCRCSRKDIASAASAPHAMDEEPMYPGTCRGYPDEASFPGRPMAWRFRVPDGEVVEFSDRGMGPQRFVAGRDFGDFVVVRQDGIPSYQLACVTDDHLMGITEVVRGADLLVSTARQILLYRALGWTIPAFFHCPLVTDGNGVRLAKRHAALALATLREQGRSPESLRASG